MNCYYHPDRDVAGMCVSCGKAICTECRTVIGGRNYCKSCTRRRPSITYKLSVSSNEATSGTKKILTRNNRQLEVAVPQGVKSGTFVKLSDALQITDGYSGDILIEIRVTGLSWFGRHLNWTVILAVVASYLLVFIVAFLLFSINPNIMNKFSVSWSYLVVIPSSVMGGWTLKRKRRSLWWLLILLVPFGWIVFLRVRNRSEFAELSRGARHRIRLTMMALKRATTSAGDFARIAVYVLFGTGVVMSSIWVLRFLFSDPNIWASFTGLVLWPVPYWDSLLSILNMIFSTQLPSHTIPLVI